MSEMKTDSLGDESDTAVSREMGPGALVIEERLSSLVRVCLVAASYLMAAECLDSCTLISISEARMLEVLTARDVS